LASLRNSRHHNPEDLTAQYLLSWGFWIKTISYYLDVSLLFEIFFDLFTELLQTFSMNVGKLPLLR
jgi:hypothetical protein